MIVLFAPAVMVSVLCDGCAGAVSVFYLLFVIYYIIVTIIIITYREIAILTGVLVIDLAVQMHNTTPSLARSFERRSLFCAQSGCNG